MSKPANSEKQLRKISKVLAFAHYYSEADACQRFNIARKTLRKYHTLLNKVPQLQDYLSQELKPLQLDFDILSKTKAAIEKACDFLIKATSLLDPSLAKNVSVISLGLSELSKVNAYNQREHDNRTAQSLSFANQSQDDLEEEAKYLLSDADIVKDLDSLEPQPDLDQDEPKLFLPPKEQ